MQNEMICKIKMMSNWKILMVVLGMFFGVVKSSGNTDEITSLPGLTHSINFRQYSGYLNATNGKFLHYWFVESQHSPSSDPLVLWMNGGPGCSSLDGLLTELGPFHINPDGKTLYMNDFSWNKVANVIFLEAPAGVGFSYSSSGQYATDDDITAKDNYLALQHFFQKFPQFKKNEFYITGESYGGIYIPTLSVLVLNGPASINFKGFAIGNGYLDADKLATSLIFFYSYHGLFDQVTWSSLVKYCCKGCPTKEVCNFITSGQDCLETVQSALTSVQLAGLNTYNLYEECYSGSNYTSNSLFRDVIDKKNMLRYFSIKDDSPPCIDSHLIVNYLNQKSVRDALHIPTNVQKWDVCSDIVEQNYTRIYHTMRREIMILLSSGKLKGLIYNGDVDMACNYLGDEWFSEDLGLRVVKEYRPWYFNKQAGGFVKEFEKLTYLTVLGSGHMVPQDKPGPAFKMISSFLFNKPY